jgi:phage terminase large subunit-like protein
MSDLSMADRVRTLGRGRAGALLTAAGYRVPTDLEGDWWFWRRKAQLPPPGDWRVWLMMAGRGFGKTRAGAEWVRAQALANPRARIALVAANMGDARAVMVEGSSGLLAVSHADDRLLWAPSLNRLRWGNGAEARLFSAAEPEGLRGPEHTLAWCDEIGKWPVHRCEAAWANLMLGLRRGRAPRVLATTTPRATPLVRRLARDPSVVRTGGRSHDNAANLAPTYIADMVALYGGTQLGRQEIDGELIEEIEGALWTRAMIEGARDGNSSPAQRRGGGGEADGGARAERATISPVETPSAAERVRGRIVPPGRSSNARGAFDLELPSALRAPPLRCAGEDFVRIVVAVDPPASATGDACGIVACGVDREGIGHVLEDASVERANPAVWARAVGDCALRWGADRIVAEANNGGEMVRTTLLAHDPSLPVVLVRARRGKGARAEPVALLYHQGRVRHRGVFPKLEDEMCAMTPVGYAVRGRSPDRADALVWALDELMLRVKPVVRVRVL